MPSCRSRPTRPACPSRARPRFAGFTCRAEDDGVVVGCLACHERLRVPTSTDMAAQVRDFLEEHLHPVLPRQRDPR